MNDFKTKPLHEIRMGCIKATIWPNKRNNEFSVNVTVSRIYKEGDNWKSSDSFRRDDLLPLCKVIDATHSWILQNGLATEKTFQNAENL